MLAELKKLLTELLAKEPALVIGAGVAGVVALCGALGIVVDEQSVVSIVGTVVAILGGALGIRSKVSPA